MTTLPQRLTIYFILALIAAGTLAFCFYPTFNPAGVVLAGLVFWPLGLNLFFASGVPHKFTLVLLSISSLVYFVDFVRMHIDVLFHSKNSTAAASLLFVVVNYFPLYLAVWLVAIAQALWMFWRRSKAAASVV